MLFQRICRTNVQEVAAFGPGLASCRALVPYSERCVGAWRERASRGHRVIAQVSGLAAVGDHRAKCRWTRCGGNQCIAMRTALLGRRLSAFFPFTYDPDFRVLHISVSNCPNGGCFMAFFGPHLEFWVHYTCVSPSPSKLIGPSFREVLLRSDTSMSRQHE